MKRNLNLATFGLGFLALGLLISVSTAQAATTGSGQALEIAPPVVTLSADPGKTLQVPINLRDISSGNLIVSNEINDFVAAGEDGTPKILMNDDNIDNPYSLRGWISPIASINLAPHQIKTITVTIKVPKNATPGGHYGVIRFTANPEELHTTGVSLSASLGSLILINVSGKTTEQLSLIDFTASKGGKSSSVFEATPITFTERIKNSGNVYEAPTGQIVITDMYGKQIGAVNINLQARNILPQSTRKFDGALDESVLGNKHLFGHYTAKLHMTYGSEKKSLDSTIAFWVVPYKLIITAIVALVIAFFFLRNTIRRYNRRIIAKATKKK